ncbi:hypothetical protein C444_17123 [Haloarcula japonica DSM 6131]|uniref:Uncharacterized protein n=1 Tax=Haloarcula japonica (strain ATCC 49778 / DSM 6131 / JCM 7785 / NBRC 101032 / NCIMB 13157 / TR-1) TaxID=1227453 RepID=M0L689_HALJT|nr:hypothetical protein C444_17123 [Haloarcula japonica DSM 6131]
MDVVFWNTKYGSSNCWEIAVRIKPDIRPITDCDEIQVLYFSCSCPATISFTVPELGRLVEYKPTWIHSFALPIVLKDLRHNSFCSFLRQVWLSTIIFLNIFQRVALKDDVVFPAENVG